MRDIKRLARAPLRPHQAEKQAEEQLRLSVCVCVCVCVVFVCVCLCVCLCARGGGFGFVSSPLLSRRANGQRCRGRYAVLTMTTPKVKNKDHPAGIPMDNPYCSCKLTRVNPYCR